MYILRLIILYHIISNKKLINRYPCIAAGLPYYNPPSWWGRFTRLWRRRRRPGVRVGV